MALLATWLESAVGANFTMTLLTTWLELAVGAVICGLSVCWLLPRAPTKRVPYAKAGWMETVAALSSPRAPWFCLEHALATPGRCYRLHLPTWSPAYVVADGAAARVLLKNPEIEKPSFYEFFEAATMGPTMFSRKTADPRWHAARKGVAHAFASRKINAALASDATGRKIEDAIELLERLARSGGSFDPAVLMTELTMDIFGVTMAGGFDFGLVRERISEMDDGPTTALVGREFIANLEPALTEYALRQPNNPLRALTLRLLPRFLARRWYPRAAAADAAAARNGAISQLVLDNFRARRAAAAPDVRAALDETIIGCLCCNQSYASDAARVSELTGFLIAGHDTTGFQLAWTLIELARHPAAAAALRADVKEKGASSEYLQAVIYESQRLWPVTAQASIRTPTTPLRLSDGIVIPKGATCFISLLAIQRAANVKRVGEFLPGRWLEKDLDPAADGFENPNLSFFPFSLGTRNCVGQNLASAELRVVLAALVTRFEFALQTPPTPNFFLTLKPDGARITAKIANS